MANHPRRDEVRLAGYEPIPAELQGEEGRCGGQDPGLRVDLEGFRRGQIGDVRRVRPDILNHMEDRGLGVIGNVLEEGDPPYPTNTGSEARVNGLNF